MIYLLFILSVLMAVMVGIFIGAYYASKGWVEVAGMGFTQFKAAKEYVDDLVDVEGKITVDFTDIGKLLQALKVCEDHDSLDVFLEEGVYHEAMELLTYEGEYEWMAKLKRLKDGK